MEYKPNDQTSSPTTIATEDSPVTASNVHSADKAGLQEDLQQEINSLFKFGSEFAAFSYDILQDATASAVVAVSDTVDAVVEAQNRMTLNSIVDDIINDLNVKISAFNSKSVEEKRKDKSADEIFNEWEAEAFQEYELNAGVRSISTPEAQRNEHSQYSIRRRILGRALEKKRQAFIYKNCEDDSKDDSCKGDDFEIVTKDCPQLSVDIKAKLENLKMALPMNKTSLLSAFDELLKSSSGKELHNMPMPLAETYPRLFPVN